MTNPVIVPYEEYATLVKDSADKANVVQLLKTDFPDDTCQLIAIKSILGIEEDDTTTTPPVTP